jgi:hypothetical protein
MSVLSLVTGWIAGLLDMWDMGTYALVQGGLGLWMVDRWDDVWGDR